MGTTVHETEKTTYTDCSGKFYKGMKYEDIDKNPSVFNKDAYEVFRRIDEDNDGELSESEITYELYRDIQAINKNINEVSGSGIIIGILSFLNSKSSRKLVRNFGKLGLGITIFDLGYAICNKLLLNKMNQRIIQGYN